MKYHRYFLWSRRTVVLISFVSFSEAFGADLPPNLPGMGESSQSSQTQTIQKPAPAAASKSQETAPAQEKKPSQQPEKPSEKQPAKSGEGAVGEYVIKGEAKLTVDSEKPTLNIPMDENKTLEPTFETEKELFLKNPPQISEVKQVAPTRQHSDFVIVPRFFEFRQDAVAHEFHPLSDLNRVFEEPDPKRAAERARWEFGVADANGRIFFSRSAKGMPPETLTVFTTNDKGEAIRVGNPYSGVLTYWDSYGNIHTTVTDSFSLSGLVYKNSKGYTVHLSINHVFQKKDGSEVSSTGTNLLQETADWIKSRRSAQVPIIIQSYAKNTNLAQEQANRLGDILTKMLKRSKGSLQSQGYASVAGLDERIEILIYSVQNN